MAQLENCLGNNNFVNPCSKVLLNVIYRAVNLVQPGSTAG